MQREKKLIKNILIFAAGNLGSKMLQFLLIPFYTNVLSTAEYGTVDLIQTGGMLLAPIFSLTIAESVFRYGMDHASNKKEVFSIGISTVSMGSLILVFIGMCVSKIRLPISNSIIWLIIGYTICNMLRTVTSQFLRAIGKTTLFSIDNVVQTGSIIGLNLLLLLKYNMGVSGYMYGYIYGNLISFIFGMLAGGLWKYLGICKMNITLFRVMLLFSIPLIPNTICWWISSSTDKLMIANYVGTDANGIYSIAHKIPSIISIVVGIFIQAWQISANEEFQKKDTGEFYSSIFDVLMSLNFIIASVLILFSKIEISIIASKSFFEAWSIMITLIVGIVYFSFASFLGTIYTANKKTSMAFVTNLMAAVVNVIVNFLLIPKWGAQGAAIATSFSYFILWICRVVDTRKIVKIMYNKKKIILSSLAVLMQSIVQINQINGWMPIAVVCMVGVLLINRDIIRDFVNIIFSKLQKRKG